MESQEEVISTLSRLEGTFPMFGLTWSINILAEILSTNTFMKPSLVIFPPSAYVDLVTKFESQLGPLLGGNLQTICDQIHPLEAAKLHASLAYCLSSLEWIQLRAAGTNPFEHPIAQELDKIKLCMKQIIAATQNQQSSENAPKAGETANTNSDDSKRLRVDASAASRLIKGALGTNTHVEKGDNGSQQGIPNVVTAHTDATTRGTTNQVKGNLRGSKKVKMPT